MHSEFLIMTSVHHSCSTCQSSLAYKNLAMPLSAVAYTVNLNPMLKQRNRTEVDKHLYKNLMYKLCS